MRNMTMNEREKKAFFEGMAEEAELIGRVIDAEASEAEMEGERDDTDVELSVAENRIAELENAIETLEALIRELRDNQ